MSRIQGTVNSMARPRAGVTFWDRANNIKIDENGCHNFLGHLNDDGYARINKDGKLVFVHREIWIKHNGEIPDKMCVCHKCDNPKCLNIGHFFLGTHAENMADRKIKGRCSDNRGAKNPSAKLSESQVIDIKNRIAAGKETCYAIAREYGVKGETILHIKNGHTWRHIA